MLKISMIIISFQTLNLELKSSFVWSHVREAVFLVCCVASEKGQTVSASQESRHY